MKNAGPRLVLESSESRDDRLPPVLKIMRDIPFEISATAPTRPAMSVMMRTSRFLMWPISWPITPWSSSRLHKARSPVVTAMDEDDWSWPVANAFGSRSSIT